MNYQYLLKHPDLFPAVIGVNKSRFEVILRRFEYHLRVSDHQRRYSFKRQRVVGGGRKARLETPAQKLFFILFYYKTYPTFRLAQATFGLDKRNVQLWKNYLEDVLRRSVSYELRLPKVKARYLHQVLEVCPKLREFAIDATERRIQRPGKIQELYYSGKKKYHSIKNQILVNPRTKKILSVSATVEGKRHDKKLAEDDPTLIHAPPGSTCIADSGYLGADKINPLVKFVIPKKKPHKRELTSSEKKNNKQISSIRVTVEHPFAFMKHFNILSHTFRNNLNLAHTPFKTLACIYNLSKTYK